MLSPLQIISVIRAYATTDSPTDLSGTAPVVIQTNNSLAAGGHGLSDFAYLQSTSQPDCADPDLQSDYRSGDSVSGLSDQIWVCFRAKNQRGIDGYQLTQVDLSEPVIEINFSDPVISASGLDLTDWGYRSGTTVFACNDSTNFTGSGQNFLIPDQAQTVFVCFRAKNQKAVWGYQTYLYYAEADISGPGLDGVSAAAATGVGFGQFHWSGGVRSGTDWHVGDGGSIPVKATNLSGSIYYGLTGNDTIGNTYCANKWSNTIPVLGYKSISSGAGPNYSLDFGTEVTGNLWSYVRPCIKKGGYYQKTTRLRRPTLKDSDILQVGDSLIATNTSTPGEVNNNSPYSDGWSSWKVARLTSGTACNRQAIFGANNQAFDYQSGSQLIIDPQASSSDHYCFANIYTLGTPLGSTLTYYKSVNIKIEPQITISQNNNSLTASSTDSDLPATPVWQNSGPHNSSNCSSTTTGFVAGKTISSIVNAKYYCFKVTDKSGNVGYQEIQANLTRPSFLLSQHKNSILVANSQATGTNSVNQVSYFTSSSNISNCSDSKTSGWTSGSIAKNQTSGHYVCFRIRNHLGVHGYSLVQVSPLTLTQTANSVAASGTGLSGFVYTTSTSYINNCDSTRTTGWTTASSVSSLSNNSWVCFRATGNNQTYYNQVQALTESISFDLARSGRDFSAVTENDITQYRWYILTLSNFSGPVDKAPCVTSKTKLASGTTKKMTVPSNASGFIYYCYAVSTDRGVWSKKSNFIMISNDSSQSNIKREINQINQDLVVFAGPLNRRVNFNYITSGRIRVEVSGPSTTSGCSSSNTGFSQISGVRVNNFTGGRYYCFKLTDTVAQITEYEEFLTLPVAENSNDGFTASGSQFKSFRYFQTDTEPGGCIPYGDSQTLTYIQAADWTTGATVNNLDPGEWVCFRAQHKTAKSWHYGKAQANFKPPAITVTQNNTTLTATADSKLLPSTPTWQKSGPHDSSDCDDQTTGFSNGSSITGAKNGKYYCFKVTGKNGKVGYGEHQADLTAPTITTNWSRSGQTATVTASSTASLKPNTWKHEKGLTSSACSSSTTIDDGSSNTATVTYAADNNKYVCFSVQNSLGVPGYGSYKVDFPPKITVSQNNTTLTAAADTSDTDLPATPVWKKTSGLGLEPNCANVASNKWSSGQTVSNAAHNKWYCFSVVDEASQTGYGKFKAIINPPTISFSQDQDSVDARATIVADTIETTSWQNFKTTTSTAPACSAANNSLFTVSPGASQNSVTISASENNYWACFRVKNSRGVHGYNKHQIDYNAPAIIVNQAGTTLTASSTDSDLPATPVWQKAGPTDTANCSSATTGFSSGKAITSVTAGKYYCFKVTDTAGNSGYQSAQASTVTPVISFSQTTTKVGVSASTSEGTIKTNSWGYFKTTDSQEPDCDANDSYTTWPHSVSSFDYTINSGDVNKWLCVRVQNSYNNWGYNKIRIDLTAPTVTVSQTGTTLTGSTDATDLPASPAWQHSNAHNTPPACSGAIAYNSGQTKTGALHNKYYCFKVTDRSGNTGYASIRVDATVPTVTVRQHQTTVFGLATTHNVAGQNLSIDDIVQNFGGDAFGLDGDRMAVGARRVGGHSGANTGAVYLFEKVNGLWQLEQALKDEASGFTELDANDQFGYSVSLEGDRLAVGVPFDDYSGTGNSGSVYIFHHNGSNWILEQELSKQTTGLTDLNSEATFGASVNLSGDTSRLVVGADGYSNGSNNYYQRIGAVYVFKRTGTSWSLEQKIDKNTRDLNIGHGDWFGVQVAIDGDYMAVGAYGDDGAGGSDAGAVHMFRRTGNSWSFYQEISDSASRSPEFTDLGGDDKFGFAMDIDGDRMIIGAPGVSQPTTGRWYKHGKRYLSNPGGATGYYISGACSNKKGNAYVFKRNSAGKWLKEAKLGNNTTGISLANGDVFGHSVAIDGSRLAVGAACDDGASGSETGAVYILKRSGSTWTLEQEISDVSSGFDHLDVNNQLGYFKVILDDDSLIAGAGGHVGRSTQESSGAAYIFTKDDSHSWAVDSRFTDQTPENFSWRHKRTGTSSTCQATTFASGTIGTGFSVTIDRAADHDDYLCFEASNDRGMKGYGSLQMKIAGPKISFSQDQDSVDASARDTGSGSLTIDSATWAHSTPGSTDPGDCSGATYNTAGSTENTVSVSAADNNDWVCFRVKNSGGAYGYGKYQIDFNAPVVTVTKTGTTLTASSTADDLAATNPYSKTTGYANLINCTTLANSKYSNGNQITTAANNHFYCFRAVDDNGNYGYARIFLGKTSNMVLMDVIISTSQDQDSLDASATSQNGTIDTSTWAHSTPNSTDPGDCSGATYNTAGSTENTVTITSADNNKYVCFKVSNSLGTSETVKAKIDFNAPTVTVSQNNTTLTGLAIDTGVGLPNAPVWKKSAALDSDPTCSANTISYSNGGTVTNATDAKYYCLQVADNAGNIGYGKTKVDLTAPVITINQNQTIVSASATTVTGQTIKTGSWAHTLPTTADQTCSTNTSYQTAGSDQNSHGGLTAAADNNKYICFKVSNSLGVTGYTKHRIDYNPPVVTVNQNGSTVTASATDAGIGLPASPIFKHTAAITDKTTTCNSGQTYSTTSKTVSSATDNKRYCFSVQDAAGNTGYGGINVDLTAPTITISQNPVAKTLTMSSNQTLSRWDWRWSGGNNNFSQACSVLTYNASSTSQSHTLTMKTNPHNDYYCFKATNTKGVISYLLYRLDLEAPTVTVSQDGSSLTYTASDDNAPTSWTWQHLTSAGPTGNCNSNQDWSKVINGQPAVIHNLQYYCFRTQDARNNYGYSNTVQVNLAAPDISLSQDSDSVDASATSLSLNTVDISNLTRINIGPGCRFSTARKCALKVTTGSAGAGYNLTQVKAQHQAPIGNPGNLIVKLHRSYANRPAATAALTLTGPNPTTAGEYSFYCIPATNNSCHLQPSTDYFVVFSASGGDSSNFYQLKMTASDDTDNNPATNGWRFDTGSLVFQTGVWQSDSKSIKIKLFSQYEADSSGPVTASTWAHSNILSSRPDCSSATYNTSGSTENTVAVTSADNNDWVCFKVENSLGLTGYGRHQIDFNKPVVSIVQNNQQLKANLTSSDPIQQISDTSAGLADLASGDRFGYSVSLNGDRMAVGAVWDDVSGCNNCGAVYIFKRNTATNAWILEEKIADGENLDGTTFSNLSAGDSFGHSVSLNGDRLAVGAPNDTGSSGSKTGAVYIFKRTGTVWSFEQEIADAASGFTDLESADFFGWNVSLNDDRLAVGAYGDDATSCSNCEAGAVYIFKRTGTVWAKEDVIEDGKGRFGYSVSLDGGRLAAGANLYGGSNNNCIMCGAAYVFERSDSNWSLTQEIHNYDGISNLSQLAVADNFGYSISLAGNRLAVGSLGDDGASGSNTGAVYVFKKTINGWLLEQEISDAASGFTNLEASDSFGKSVSLSGDYLAVSAHNDYGVDGQRSGAVYVFKWTGSAWNLIQEISDSGSGFTSLSHNDHFGRSVSLDDDRLAVGVPGSNDTNTTHIGAVYEFRVSSANSGSYKGPINKSPTPTCSSQTGYSSGQTVTGASHDKYYCFKITDDAGNTSYEKILVDTTAPIISFTQDQDSIDASAGNNIRTATWAHSNILTVNPTCSSLTDYNTAGHAEYKTLIGSNKSTEDGDWVCFKVTNNLGITGYAKHTIDFTAPAVSVSQNNTTLTASASDAGIGMPDTLAWRSTAALNTAAVCDSSQTYTANSSGTISGATNNKRYCFSVKDDAGNIGYGGINVDLTKPTLTLVQDNDKIKLDPTTGLSDIGYFTSSSDPDCDGDDTYTAGATTTAMTDDHWACFKAKNSLGVYNFAEKQIDLTTPVISLSQDQNSVDATATMAGSPTIDSDTWAHSDILTSNPTCSSTSTTYDTAGSTENTAPIGTSKSTEDGDWVCFKVANSLGVYGYAKWTIDFTAPTVTVSQAGSTLTAASTDSDAVSSTWKHSGALSSDPTCSSGVTYANSGKTKTSATTGKYYCFKVADNKGNLGYGKILVNLTAPVITLSQDQDSVDASATMAGSPTIDTSTWAHSNVLTTNPTCSGASYNTAGSSENTAAVDSGDDGDYICFKVANSLGVYSYAKWTIDFTAPTVTVSQAGSTVTASATDAGVGLPDSPVFKHTAALNTTASCNSSQTYSTASATISSVTTGKRYCFQVKDKAGNIGYGGINVDLTKPTLTLVQDNDKIKLDPTTGLSDIGYFTSSSDPDCDGDDTYTAGATTTAMTDDHWACFKAKNSLGVYNFAEKQIDLTTPVISLSQDQNSVDATATMAGSPTIDSDTWAHSDILTSNPTCSSTSTTYDTAGSTENTAPIGTSKSTEDGDWVCFKVANSLGVYGYAKWTIDFTAPTVTVSQAGSTLTAASTDSDAVSSTWKHSGALSSDPTCSSGVTYANSGKTKTSATTGKYYCFKVADNKGNLGYGKILVNLTAPVITLSQDQDSVDATATMAGSPTIDTSTWAHSNVLTTNPTCSGASYNTAGSSENTAAVDSGDDGDYICFKVANSLGVYSYAKWTIDFTAPTVTVSQAGSTVTASATDAGVGLPDSPVFKHTAALNTTASCNSSQTYSTASATISSVTTGKRYCFQVKDKAGNIGYGGINVDLTKPTLTLVQDNDKIKLDPTTGLSDIGYFTSSSDPDCDGDDTYTAGATTTAMTDDHWACFKAKNSLGVYNFAEKQIDLTTPVISLSQDQNSVDATATMAGSPTIDSDTWAHSDILTSNPTCSSTSTTYDTAGSTENTAPIGTSKSTEDGDWVCFKVANSLGVYGYAKWTIDFTAPTVTVSQAGSTLTAASTDSDAVSSTWKHSGALSSDPTCSSGVTYANSGKTKTSATTGKYYCFKVADNKGNLGYGKILVNLTAPVITLSQDQDSVDASATMAGSPTIDTSTWAHSNVLTTNPTCSGASYNTAGSSENTAAVDSGDDGDYICFKVANSLGVYSYAKWTIDFTAPTVTVSQAGSTVTASATDAGVGLPDSPVFKHTAALNTTASCNSSQTYSTASATISSVTTGKRYCFQVKDKAGNIGYGGINVDLTKPTLTLVQDNDKIKLDPTTGLSDIGYFTSSSDPDCDGDDTYTAGATTTAMTDDHWACFKAKNSLGVYNFAEKQIDLTTPVISLSQDQNSVDATATMAGSPTIDSDTWAHSDILTSNPTCSSTSTTYDTAGSTENTAPIGTSKSTEDGDWVCFKVANSLGVYGYAKWTIDFTAPTVTVSQAGSTLTAASTDSDAVSSTWKHSGALSSDPTCSSGVTYANSGKTKTSATTGKYYCFKVADNKGNLGYGKILVNLTAPVITLSQDQDSVDASATMAGSPTIDTSTWAHSNVLTTNPTCSGASYNTAGSSENTAAVDSGDDGDYICFKVANSLGVYSYAKWTIDFTAPTVTVSQAGSTVTASATDAGVGLPDSPVFKHTAALNTTASCNSSQTYSTASATISSVTTGKRYCFQVKDKAGNIGYGGINVDLTKPTLTLVQDNDKIKLDPTTGLSDIGYFTSSSDPDCDGDDTYTAGATTTAMTDDHWACFKAKNSLGVYNFAEKQIDLTTPVISLSQDQNSVDATATMAGSPTIDSDTWAHSDILTSNPTCSSTSTTYDTAGSTENTAPIGTSKSTEDGDWVCFKVANSLGVYGYAKWTIDFTAPTVTVSQAGSTLTAASTDSDAVSSTWKHSGALSSDPTCSSGVTYANSGKTKTSATTGKYYCFKVADNKGNLGYGKILVNLTAPVITLSQDQDSVDATATMAGSPTIDTSTWAHSNVLTTNPTCSGASYNTAGSSENTAAVDSGDDGDYICFKVANSLGVYSYAKWTIDFTAPTVTVSQAGSTVTASATDAGVGLPDSPVFKHTAALNTTASCNSSQTYSTASATISSVTTGKRYCFQVKDKAGNIGYGGINVDLTKPTLTLVQDNDKIKLDPTTGLSDIGYFTSSSDPDCDGDDTYTAGATTTAMTDDHWACFKAKNSLGVYNFAEKQIDLTTPVISLSQDQNSVDATATMAGSPTIDSDTWAHSDILTSNPTCSSTSTTYDTAGSTENTAPIGTSKSTEDGDWVCFKVANSLGVYGYAKWTIDFTAPTVTVSQAGSTLTAASTDSDAVSSTWKHSGALSSDPTCSSGVTYANSGKTKTSATTGKYYCFKVADNKGNLGYGKILVNLTAPVITLSQDQDSVDASATMAGSPTIDTSTWAHSNVLTTNPTCSGASYNTAGSSENTAAVDSGDDGDYICFKVANSLGVYSYAKWTIDFTAPTVTVSQAGSTVTASATDAGVGLPDSPVFKHTAALNTTASCNSSQTYSTASATISSVTTGKRYCFQVKDKAGNIGYGGINVDLTKPTLTLVQDNDKIKLDPTTGLSDIGYFTSSSDPDCDGDDTYTAGATTTAMTDDHWACFKAKNSLGVYNFAEKQIDLTTPVISLSQDQNSVDATATMAGSPTIDSDTWAHSDILTSNPTCSSTSTTYDTAGSTENTAPIGTSKSTEDGDWVCFKVANSLGVYGYAKWTIDFTAPTVTVSQAGSTLTAASTDSDAVSSTWKHSGALSSDPTCSSGVTYANSGKTKTSATTGKYYCFKVADNKGNLGYGKILVNLTAPVITLSQDQDSVDATATMAGSPTIDTSTWAHSNVLTTNPTCSEASYNTAGSDQNTAAVSSTDDGDYICFKVANSLGAYGYSEWQIDFTAPAIDIAQTGTTLTASSTATDLPASPVWQKSAALNSNPTSCSDSSISYSNGNIVSNAVSGKYYCFKVTDKQSNTGYGKATPDTTKPSLTLVQANDRIKLQSTAGLSDIKYFITGTDPDCDNNDDWDNAKSGSTTTAMDDNDWACFRAKNSNSVYGYADLQLLASKRTQTETASPVAPAVSLKQVNDTVVAAGDGILSWAYKINPVAGCRSGVSFSDGRFGFTTTASNLQHQDLVCFRALGQGGLYGYAGLTVNLNQPVLNFSQNQTRLTATAATNGSAAVDSGSWANLLSADPDQISCDAASSYTTSGAGADSIAITATDNDRRACFRVANTLGVYGYGQYQIDYNPPAVSVSQTGSTLTAASQADDLDSDNPWHYSPVATGQDCSGLDLSTWKVGNSVDNISHQSRYCFRATDNNGNPGYGLIEADLNPVTITVSQNQSLVQARAGSEVDNSNWANFMTADSQIPDCDDSGSYTTSGAGADSVKISRSDRDRWVCFRVANTLGVYGYSRHQIDYTAPTVSVTRTGTSLVVTSSDTDLADDAYYHSSGSDSQPDCPSLTDASYRAGDTISDAGAGLYYCFRVGDKNGNFGYDSYQMPPDQPAAVQTPAPNNNPAATVSDSRGSGAAALPDSLTANIAAGQLNLAAIAGLSNWQYVIIGLNQNCNESAFDGNFTSGAVVDLSSIPANGKVCFRATDHNNQFSYYQTAGFGSYLSAATTATSLSTGNNWALNSRTQLSIIMIAGLILALAVSQSLARYRSRQRLADVSFYVRIKRQVKLTVKQHPALAGKIELVRQIGRPIVSPTVLDKSIDINEVSRQRIKLTVNQAGLRKPERISINLTVRKDT